MVCDAFRGCFFLHPVILQYCFEFRPYILAVTLLLCFLNFFEQAINSDKEANADESVRTAVGLCGLALILELLTLGMQPLLIALSALIGVYALDRRSRSLVLTIGASLIFYFPFGYFVFQDAPKVFRSAQNLKLSALFEKENVYAIVQTFFWLRPWSYLVVLGCLGGLFGFARRRGRAVTKLDIALSFLVGGFLISVGPFYYSFVRFWEMQARYVILGFPLLAAACIVFIEFEFRNQILGVQASKRRMIFLIAILIVTSSQCLEPLEWYRADYRSIYQELNVRMSEHDRMVLFQNPQCDQWGSVSAISGEFYLRPDIVKVNTGDLTQLLKIQNQNVRSLYVVYEFKDRAAPARRFPPQPGVELIASLPDASIYRVELNRIAAPLFLERWAHYFSEINAEKGSPMAQYLNLVGQILSGNISKNEAKISLHDLSKCVIDADLEAML